MIFSDNLLTVITFLPTLGALIQEGIDVAVILNALRASAPAIRARRVTSAIP